MYVCGYACMHVFMDVCLTVILNYVEKHVFTTKCNGRNSQVLGFQVKGTRSADLLLFDQEILRALFSR